MTRRLTDSAVALSLLLGLVACATAEGEGPCSEGTLFQSWKSEQALSIWRFGPEGALECQGICDYGPELGQPLSWAPDPSANLWASGLDYLKLEFSEQTFEGTLGAVRCRTEDAGQRLVLEQFRGPDLVFTLVMP